MANEEDFGEIGYGDKAKGEDTKAGTQILESG